VRREEKIDMSASNDMVDHCQQLKKQDVPKNLKNNEEPVEKHSRQVSEAV
jgi:hypothetical protein